MRLREIFAAVSILAVAGCATTGVEPARGGAAKAKVPSKPAFRQADISGRDAATLDKLLGAPALTRKEGEGEFRRYAFAECSLIVVLYPDEKGTLSAKALDAAAKVSGEPKPDLDLCLARGLAKSA